MSGDGRRGSLATTLLKKRQSLTCENSISATSCPFSSATVFSQPVMGCRSVPAVTGRSSGGRAQPQDTMAMTISTSLLKKRQSIPEQYSVSSTHLRGSTAFTCPSTGMSSSRTSNMNTTTQDGNGGHNLKKRSLSEQIPLTNTSSNALTACPMGSNRAVSSIAGSSKVKKEHSSSSNILLKKRQSLEQNSIESTSSSTHSTALSSRALVASRASSSKSSPQDTGAGSGSSNITFSKFSSSSGYFSQVLRVSWNIIGQLNLTITHHTSHIAHHTSHHSYHLLTTNIKSCIIFAQF